MMDYPKPGSVEAIDKGCTCNPVQDNQNWLIVAKGCPMHDNFDYIYWQASQGKKRKR